MKESEIMVVCERPDGCNGTGLYDGINEPKGTAVLCGRCKGSGGVIKKVFTSRVKRDDIKTIIMGRGENWERKITYEQFLQYVPS